MVDRWLERQEQVGRYCFVLFFLYYHETIVFHTSLRTITGLAAGNYVPNLDRKTDFVGGLSKFCETVKGWHESIGKWEHKKKSERPFIPDILHTHKPTHSISVMCWERIWTPSYLSSVQRFTAGLGPPQSVGPKLCESLSDCLRSSPEPRPSSISPPALSEEVKKWGMSTINPQWHISHGRRNSTLLIQ